MSKTPTLSEPIDSGSKEGLNLDIDLINESFPPTK